MAAPFVAPTRPIDPAAWYDEASAYAGPPNALPAELPKAAESLHNPNCYWQPVPFSPGRDVLGPEDEARQVELDAWDVPLLTPKCHTSGPSDSPRIGVKQIMRALVDDLCDTHGWAKMRVWLGGSGVLWRLGGAWTSERPQDLDPIVFVPRQPNRGLEDLNDAIRDSYMRIVRRDLALSDTQMRDVRLNCVLLPSAETSDLMLLVQLGHRDDHVDVRFVCADGRFRPYDFRCNALLCDLFDPTAWATMPGVDARALLEDIRAGVYHIDHRLSDNSIMRVWKARCRGLTPASHSQDAGLFEQFSSLLNDLGEHHSLSVGYNLAHFLSREIGDVQQDVVRAKKAAALLLNAIVHTECHVMPEHKARVLSELRRLLDHVALHVPQNESLAQVLRAAMSKEGIADWALWSSIWAEPQAALRWPASKTGLQVTMPTSGAPGYLRVWMPSLNAFVMLPHIESLSTGLLRGEAPALQTSHSPAQSGIARAAAYLGDAGWAHCAPPAAASDEPLRQAAAQRLVQCAVRQHVAPRHLSLRLACAALQLSDTVRLTSVLQDALFNGPLDAHQARSVRRHKAHLAQRAASFLCQTHPAPTQKEEARAQAWMDLLSALDIDAKSGTPDVNGDTQRIGQSIIETLAQRDTFADVDAGPLTKLIAAMTPPHLKTASPQLLAWVQLRALLPHTTHPALRRLLRPAVEAAKVHLHLRDPLTWRNLLSRIGQSPRIPASYCALLDILAVTPDLIDVKSAQRVLTTLPQVPNCQIHLRAAAKALLTMTSDKPALKQLTRQGFWVDAMIKHPRTSRDTLTVLLSYDCPLANKTAVWAAEHYTMERSNGSVARYILQQSAARTAYLDAAGRHIETLFTYEAMRTFVGDVTSFFGPPQWRKGPEWARFIQTSIRNYGRCEATGVSASPKPLSALELGDWLHGTTYSSRSDVAFVIGISRLHTHAQRPRDALALLTEIAPRVFANDEMSEAVADALIAHSSALPEDHIGEDDAGLCALARCICSANVCHPKARKAARTLAGHVLTLLTERQAPSLAIAVFEHVHDIWMVRRLGDDVMRVASNAASDTRADAWRTMLHKAILSHGSPDVFIPLFDAMATTRIAVLAAQARDMRPAELKQALETVFFDCCTRRKVVRYKTHNALGAALVRLLQDDAVACVAPDALLVPIVNTEERNAWQDIWTAWVTAAPEPYEKRHRAIRVLRHNGLDIDACKVLDFAPTAREEIIRNSTLIPLLDIVCTDPVTHAFCLDRWRFACETILKHAAKYSWLHALSQTDPTQERKLTSLVAFNLVKEIRPEQARTSAERADVLQDGLMAMSFVVRSLARIDPKIAALNINTILRKMTGCMGHDPHSCTRLLLEFEQVPSVQQEHIDLLAIGKTQLHADYAQQKLRFETRATPLLSNIHGNDIDAWLHTSRPEALVVGLRDLFCMDYDVVKKSGILPILWRAHLAQSLRNHDLSAAIVAFVQSLADMPLGHAKSGFALNVVFDALWDTGRLDARCIEAFLQEMPRTLENWKSRPALKVLTDKMVLWALEHKEVHLNGSLVTCAHAWANKHKRSDPLLESAQSLLAALEHAPGKDLFRSKERSLH